MSLAFTVDGRRVELADDGGSLLDALRDGAGVRSPKDGCSPQGQCGCCTVLVDGQPRVACVTPARRVDGRSIVTVDGLDGSERDGWADAFLASGASQCGFCTPGIILRLAALADRRRERVEQALLAHLCRCTGWQTIVEAATAPAGGPRASDRDLAAASRRATIEGGSPQRVDREVVLGRGGFADDTAPPDALVAVASSREPGEWVVAETLAEARRLAGKVQGRRSTAACRPPLSVAPGEWALRLRTSWVEPAYLEPDASWCVPGGEPVSPLANGGAFGAKTSSAAPAAARRLADRLGRPVRVLLAREDVVRMGPKRPPIAAGLRPDGTGVVRVVRTPGIASAIARALPGVTVEELDVVGPPTSASIRGAGWAEAAVLSAALRGEAKVETDAGATASASLSPDGSRLEVGVSCGRPLDETVLRSYCIGAAHMALGWVRSEGIAVDPDGAVHDLTIRSFGILRARDMPRVDVHVDASDREPVNGSDAVFAAVAAAAWMDAGLAEDWPTGQGRAG